MELNEQNVAVEMVEGLTAAEHFGKGFVVGGVVAVALAGAIKLVGKYVVKPLAKKFMKKSEDKVWEEAKQTLSEVREDDEE